MQTLPIDHAHIYGMSMCLYCRILCVSMCAHGCVCMHFFLLGFQKPDRGLMFPVHTLLSFLLVCY